MNTVLRNDRDDGIGAAEIMIPALIGLGAAAAVSVLLVFIVGAAIYATADPNKLVTAGSLLTAAAASFTAGFVGARRGRSLLCGVISGAFLAVILFAASFITSGGGALPAPYSYLFRAGAFALSVLGAFLASRLGGKRMPGAPRVPKIKKR